MAEIIKPERFTRWQLSEDEMTRQFLEDCVQTFSYHLQKARSAKDQFAIEMFSEILAKTRRVLRDKQDDPVTS